MTYSSNLYATDGKCHNAEAGSYNHECGKPAVWLGTDSNGFTSGFCDACKVEGWERHGKTWRRLGGNPTPLPEIDVLMASGFRGKVRALPKRRGRPTPVLTLSLPLGELPLGDWQEAPRGGSPRRKIR